MPLRHLAIEVENVSFFSAVLSAVAAINAAVVSGNAASTLAALENEDACLANLDENCSEKYLQALAQTHANKPPVRNCIHHEVII